MSSNRRDFLELKASLGTLTEAERAELDRIKADRSYAFVNSSGVLVQTIRPYTVEEWKEIVKRSRGTGFGIAPEKATGDPS